VVVNSPSAFQVAYKQTIQLIVRSCSATHFETRHTKTGRHLDYVHFIQFITSVVYQCKIHLVIISITAHALEMTSYVYERVLLCICEAKDDGKNCHHQI